MAVVGSLLALLLLADRCEGRHGGGGGGQYFDAGPAPGAPGGSPR